MSARAAKFVTTGFAQAWPLDEDNGVPAICISIAGFRKNAFTGGVRHCISKVDSFHHEIVEEDAMVGRGSVDPPRSGSLGNLQ